MQQSKPQDKKTMNATELQRQQREAAVMRENLRKRKQQQQARAGQSKSSEEV